MTERSHTPLHTCIACGGTGGHLFPGIAVARKLQERGCEVSLMISPKDVDQEAVKNLPGMRIVTLPAVGLTSGARLAFMRGFAKSYGVSSKYFAASPPILALAMGGFTSAPPILAARVRGARIFLHESNSIAGRANRWLSWFANEAFVGFPGAATRLHARLTTVTGTPVRSEFVPADAAQCRIALGLHPHRPVVLVMGGSQGAEGINRLVLQSLPAVLRLLPDCQWLHIAGPGNASRIQDAYRKAGVTASVYGFLSHMELALGAATVAISRAGASSLAELAAMRVPAILIPYPAATDNHQYHNARAFSDAGAARLLEQNQAGAEDLHALLLPLMQADAERRMMQQKLASWHTPSAAEFIAQTMLERSGFATARDTDLPGRTERSGTSTKEAAA